MVTVIIPTYNRGNVLVRAINSVLAQTYQEIELLIIDDASTDETEKIVKSIPDQRIRYIKSEKKIGANGARNLGIENSLGEYIAFQDSDDEWYPDKLSKQMKLFERNPELGVVFCRYKKQMADGTSTLIPNSNFSCVQLTEQIQETIAQGNVIGTPTLVIRKQVFDEVGVFDSTIPRFQDWELAIRFAQECQFGFVDEALMTAYESEISISTVKGSQLEAVLLITNKHKNFLEEKKSLKKHLSNIAGWALEEGKLHTVLDTLGEQLFLQGLYGHYAKVQNTKKNFAVLKQWIVNGCNEQAVNQFFERYEDKTIVVYGMGELGETLLTCLTEENKKKIRFVIERNKKREAAYEMKTVKELQKEDFEEVECVLNTAVAHETEIRNTLEKIASVNLVSMTDVING